MINISTNNRVFITGDVHGDIDFHKFNKRNFPIGTVLTRNDYVIVCGDMGVVWDNGGQDAYLQKWFENRPWTTLFVDG